MKSIFAVVILAVAFSFGCAKPAEAGDGCSRAGVAANCFSSQFSVETIVTPVGFDFGGRSFRSGFDFGFDGRSRRSGFGFESQFDFGSRFDFDLSPRQKLRLLRLLSRRRGGGFSLSTRGSFGGGLDLSFGRGRRCWD